MTSKFRDHQFAVQITFLIHRFIRKHYMSFRISPLSLLVSMQDHVTEVLQFLQEEQALTNSKKEEHHMQSTEDNE